MMNPLFDPIAYVRDIEEAARTGNWTIAHFNSLADRTSPWLHRASPNPKAPRFYLSTGIHGDEISGPIALLEMLRRPNFFAAHDITIFPILNPNGLAQGIRGNADGLDLNRDYRDPKSTEIGGHVALLKTLGRFDAAMFLHEDFEGTGAYLYELNESLSPTLGADIIAAMGKHVPIDLRPEIEEIPARNGIIQRRDIVLKHGAIEERPEWPEAIYLSVNHTKVSYTTETPMLLPLEQRVKAQIAAVETLLKALSS